MFSKPFRLVGNRGYVQASQMLARAAELAPFGAGEGVNLRACGFHRLAVADVEVDLLPDPDFSRPEYCGHASFVGSDRSWDFGFRDTNLPVERVDEGVSWELRPTVAPSGLSGDFAFDGMTDFEALLEIVIAAVKSMHAQLAPDVTDIWFTGCRKTDLPVRPPAGSGLLLVRPIRIMGGAGQFQTLCSVELRFPNEVRRAIVSYAFKSREFRHVD